MEKKKKKSIIGSVEKKTAITYEIRRQNYQWKPLPLRTKVKCKEAEWYGVWEYIQHEVRSAL